MVFRNLSRRSKNYYRKPKLKRKRVAIFIYFFLSFLLFLLLAYYLLFKIFVVKNVQLEENAQILFPEEIHKILEKQKNKPLVFLNISKTSKEIELDILKFNIKIVFLKKIFPRTLFLDLKQRKPIAVIKSLDDFYFRIDPQGMVLYESDQDTNDFVVINTLKSSSSIKQGSFLGVESISCALQVLDELNSIKEDINYINVYEFTELILKNGTKFTFSNNCESKNFLSNNIKLLQKKFKEENKYPKSVDLRFSNPYLIY